jgi:hypothetical protein
MTQLEILLLEFSRDRKSYHDTLMHCEELEESRQALRRSGFNPEHPSGAKQILSPSDYEDMKTMKLPWTSRVAATGDSNHGMF